MTAQDPGPDRAYDLLALGRVGVDLYPLQHGVTLDEVSTFEKFLGGSAANVTVAAARHGRSSALISATADDAFGRFVHRQLLQLGVDDAHVATITGGPPTPVTFCEVMPPDHFPIWFYRYPTAPDLMITVDSLPLQAIRDARIFWATLTGLSQEPSRAAHLAAWEERSRRVPTVLDLDYRPCFWDDPLEARRQVARGLRQVTIAIGTVEECELATGESDPDAAARALLGAGIDLAVVKQGPRGVLAVSTTERVQVDGFPVTVVNALGAGDALGGALVHGLLEGWDLERALHFANVAGAIVASRAECSAAMPTTSEVQQMLSDIEVTDGTW
jgi:5-dehydro-2-deoxygluconokinase